MDDQTTLWFLYALAMMFPVGVSLFEAIRIRRKYGSRKSDLPLAHES